MLAAGEMAANNSQEKVFQLLAQKLAWNIFNIRAIIPKCEKNGSGIFCYGT